MDGFYIKPNSLLKLQNKVRTGRIQGRHLKNYQRAIIFSYLIVPYLRSFPPYFYVIMGYHVVLCSLL